MRDISEQFHGKVEIADWIKASRKILKLLKDKVPFKANHEQYVVESHFWTMGPIKSKPGKYFLYWHSKGGSCEKEIKSISIIKDTKYVMFFCEDCKWHKMDTNRSAWNWAKLMDLFLQGAYTDIPPLDMRDLLDYLRDARAPRRK